MSTIKPESVYRRGGSRIKSAERKGGGALLVPLWEISG